MQVSKEKICKCGHTRTKHYKNPESKFKFAKECNKCRCNLFLDRNSPTISDKIFLGLGIFLGVGIIAMWLIPFEMEQTIPNHETLKIPIKMDGLLVILFAITCMMIFYCILPIFIYPYFDYKKRKSYPIE